MRTGCASNIGAARPIVNRVRPSRVRDSFAAPCNHSSTPLCPFLPGLFAACVLHNFLTRASRFAPQTAAGSLCCRRSGDRTEHCRKRCSTFFGERQRRRAPRSEAENRGTSSMFQLLRGNKPAANRLSFMQGNESLICSPVCRSALTTWSALPVRQSCSLLQWHCDLSQLNGNPHTPHYEDHPALYRGSGSGPPLGNATLECVRRDTPYTGESMASVQHRAVAESTLAGVSWETERYCRAMAPVGAVLQHARRTGPLFVPGHRLLAPHRAARAVLAADQAIGLATNGPDR